MNLHNDPHVNAKYYYLLLRIQKDMYIYQVRWLWNAFFDMYTLLGIKDDHKGIESYVQDLM